MNLEWDRWEEEFPDTGYLEAHVAGVGLAIAGRKVLTGGNGGQSSTLAESRDARYVFEALRQGNPQARALVEKALVMLGVGVANMVSILDPEMIVFNGGIVQGAPELLLETVTRVVGRIHPKAPSVQLSSLGDKAQIWERCIRCWSRSFMERSAQVKRGESKPQEIESEERGLLTRRSRAGDFNLAALFNGGYYRLASLRRTAPAMPSKPVPSRVKVAGSGTGAGEMHVLPFTSSNSKCPSSDSSSKNCVVTPLIIRPSAFVENVPTSL